MPIDGGIKAASVPRTGHYSAAARMVGVVTDFYFAPFAVVTPVSGLAMRSFSHDRLLAIVEVQLGRSPVRIWRHLVA